MPASVGFAFGAKKVVGDQWSVRADRITQRVLLATEQLPIF
jgi:hypothetical protein